MIVQGFDFKTLPVGTRLKCNDVILEITQIGKQCHNGCEIFKLMGDCIMPREGVFAKVIHGGTISEGDEMGVRLTDGEERLIICGYPLQTAVICVVCTACRRRESVRFLEKNFLIRLKLSGFVLSWQSLGYPESK